MSLVEHFLGRSGGGAPLGGENTGGRGLRFALTTSASRDWSSHSMTSSARSRSDGGIVRPRAFAVFLLMTSLVLDPDALTIDVPKVTQAPAEAIEEVEARGLRRRSGEPYPPDLPGLLRLTGERRGEKADGQDDHDEEA